MSDPIRKLMTMIRGVAARCVLRLVDDGLKMQAVQIGLLADEEADGVERMQNYGLTSVPMSGAEGLCLFLGGSREHGVVIAMDDRRYRLKGLAGGEVALYSIDDQEAHGHRIVLKRGGVIEMHGRVIQGRASEELDLSAKVLKLHADERLLTDCGGYGEAVNCVGGVWSIDSYRQGATPTTTEHGVQPPEVP